MSHVKCAEVSTPTLRKIVFQDCSSLHARTVVLLDLWHKFVLGFMLRQELIVELSEMLNSSYFLFSHNVICICNNITEFSVIISDFQFKLGPLSTNIIRITARVAFTVHAYTFVFRIQFHAFFLSVSICFMSFLAV